MLTSFRFTVTASGLIRFLRLLAFSPVRYIEDPESTLWHRRSLVALPQLWHSQHRRFTSNTSSLSSHLDASSTELTAVLYLLAAFFERTYGVGRIHHHRYYNAGAAHLWCRILDEIPERSSLESKADMKPYIDRIRTFLRPIAARNLGAVSSDILLRHMPNLSDGHEKRAKAAVAEVMQIFESNSIQECGPISLASPGVWQLNERNASWEWPRGSKEEWLRVCSELYVAAGPESLTWPALYFVVDGIAIETTSRPPRLNIFQELSVPEQLRGAESAVSARSNAKFPAVLNISGGKFE